MRMVLDAEGNLTDAIRLENKSAKGSSGGVAYMSERLKAALANLLAVSNPINAIVETQSGPPLYASSLTSWFWPLYRD